MTDANEGTLQYKRDHRRRAATFGIAAFIAVIAGFAFGYALDHAEEAGGLNPTVAIVLAAMFVIAMAAANWIYLRHADELDWTNNVRASFWALMIHVMFYPAWLILSSGGVVPKPDAETIYLVTIFSAGAVYLWKRYR